MLIRCLSDLDQFTAVAISHFLESSQNVKVGILSLRSQVFMRTMLLGMGRY